MKKNKKKLGFMIMYLLVIILFLKNAKANVLYEGKIHRAEYISDLYIHKERSDGYYQYYHAGILRKSTDNNFVYCLEPFVDIEDDYQYEIVNEDYANLLSLTDEDWKKIELLAYYGYNYKENGYDHTSSEWYYITQMEIWRVVDKTIKVYFTDGLNGAKKERFADEFAELNKLVEEHDILPNITLPEKLSTGHTYTFVDTNQVLKYYDIASSNNIKIKKEGNNLTIEALDLGDVNLTFIKKGNLYLTNPVLYFSNYIQKTLEVGNYTPTKYTINTKIEGTKLKIIKIDSETSKPIPLANLKFQITDENDDLVCDNDICEFVTNEEGIINLNKSLGYGKYTLKELDSAMPGYLLNLNPLEFRIDETTPSTLEIHYPNTRAKGEIVIHKYGEKLNVSDGTYSYEEIPLDNVIFDIYAAEDIIVAGQTLYSKDDFIASVVTSKGIASYNLEFGKYYLIERNSNNDNLVNNEPIYFALTYQDNKTAIVYEDIDVHNYLPKGRLEFLKIDKENNLKLKDTIIAIYNEDNEKIYEGATNEEGLIIIEDLPLGKYTLKEIKAPDNYQLSTEVISFEITEDKETIKVTMNNIHIPKKEEPKEPDEPGVKDYYVEVPNTSIDYIYNYTFILPKNYTI